MDRINGNLHDKTRTVYLPPVPSHIPLCAGPPYEARLSSFHTCPQLLEELTTDVTVGYAVLFTPRPGRRLHENEVRGKEDAFMS